jgi:hypothetical protein
MKHSERVGARFAEQNAGEYSVPLLSFGLDLSRQLQCGITQRSKGHADPIVSCVFLLCSSDAGKVDEDEATVSHVEYTTNRRNALCQDTSS